MAFDGDLSRIAFTLENRAGRSHETDLKIAGLRVGTYEVKVGDNVLTTLTSSDGAELHVRVPIVAALARVTISRVTSSQQ